MGKKVLVFLGHNNDRSLCAGLAQAYASACQELGGDVRLVRLSQLQFNPAFDFEDPHRLEPDLEQLQANFTWAEHVTMVYIPSFHFSNSWFSPASIQRRASKPDTTSNSSSSMVLWRNRWYLLFRSASNSSMFLSARCMAAKRLAFSLASDSAQALNKETKRYSRMSARKVAVPPPTTCGKFFVGQGMCVN